MARHVRGCWGALGTFVTVSAAVGAFASIVFVLRAEAVAAGPSMGAPRRPGHRSP